MSQAASKAVDTESLDVPALVSELNDLRNSRQALFSRVNELQSELEEAKEDVLAAKRECDRMERELDRVRQDSRRTMEERDTEFDALRKSNQNKIGELERQLDLVTSEAAKANQEQMRLTHDLEEAKSNLVAAQEAANNEAGKWT